MFCKTTERRSLQLSCQNSGASPGRVSRCASLTVSAHIPAPANPRSLPDERIHSGPPLPFAPVGDPARGFVFSPASRSRSSGSTSSPHYYEQVRCLMALVYLFDPLTCINFGRGHVAAVCCFLTRFDPACLCLVDTQDDDNKLFKD